MKIWDFFSNLWSWLLIPRIFSNLILSAPSHEKLKDKFLILRRQCSGDSHGRWERWVINYRDSPPAEQSWIHRAVTRRIQLWQGARPRPLPPRTPSMEAAGAKVPPLWRCHGASAVSSPGPLKRMINYLPGFTFLLFDGLIQIWFARVGGVQVHRLFRLLIEWSDICG